MKKIAVIQSNYIPWKGYFDIIRQVDEFYLYDCVQYTPRNWRNRNCIKTKDGMKWLTIPLLHSSRSERVCDKIIADPHWNIKHWNALCHAYAKAPYFKHYKDQLENTYRERSEKNLSQVNLVFLDTIKKLLHIDTPLVLLTDYKRIGDKNEALIQLCLQAKAQVYLTGPSTQAYMDENRFNAAGITVEWVGYDYPEYRQLYQPFEHKVTVLDLLFNEGPDALQYMEK